MQLSVAVRNARLDAIETAIGASAVLKIRTGAAPASCAAADAGTVLATLSLPADWMAAASSGAKAMSGTWSDGSADAAGTAAHFRVYASDGTTCGLQGTVTDGSVVWTPQALSTAGLLRTISSKTVTTDTGLTAATPARCARRSPTAKARRSCCG